jgi:hypothetical protein
VSLERDLLTLLVSDNEPSPLIDPLELFVGQRLVDAGVWDSWRTSDGIKRFRVLEHGESRVRLSGEIWKIDDQSLHVFWLNLVRESTQPDRVAWTLHFDVLRPRARDAVDLLDRAEDGEWAITLSGIARVRDGVLVTDPES